MSLYRLCERHTLYYTTKYYRSGLTRKLSARQTFYRLRKTSLSLNPRTHLLLQDPRRQLRKFSSTVKRRRLSLDISRCYNRLKLLRRCVRSNYDLRTAYSYHRFILGFYRWRTYSVRLSGSCSLRTGITWFLTKCSLFRTNLRSRHRIRPSRRQTYSLRWTRYTLKYMEGCYSLLRTADCLKRKPLLGWKFKSSQTWSNRTYFNFRNAIPSKRDIWLNRTLTKRLHCSSPLWSQSK